MKAQIVVRLKQVEAALIAYAVANGCAGQPHTVRDLSSQEKVVVQQCDPEKSLFGVGYVTWYPDVAKLYSEIGVRWMKVPEVKWGRVEPEPPSQGVHRYQWDLLDKILKIHQEYGLQLQLVAKATSPWASKPMTITAERGTLAQGIATAPPKDEYWDDYGDFIGAMVERYDHDGIDDMPGLRFPIVYYEVESEAEYAVHWQGTIDEYIRLLKIAYSAAKKAYPDSKIILSGINFGDLFDDMPDAATIQKRADSLPDAYKHAVEFVRRTLQVKEFYDAIEFHYNRDYPGIYGTVQWIRQYSDKPIWAGDASSAPFLFGYFVKPYPDGQELFDRISAGKQPETDWYRAEQASLAAKKFVVAAEVGLQRVIMETTAPWDLTGKSPAAVDYMWDLFSMIDQNHSPYPAFYTLGLLVAKLDAYDAVKRLDLGKGVFAYEFVVHDKRVYVLWYDDGAAQRPDIPQGKTAVDLSAVVRSGRIKLTHIVTERGKIEPEVETRSSENVPLTETPISVEAI